MSYFGGIGELDEVAVPSTMLPYGPPPVPVAWTPARVEGLGQAADALSALLLPVAIIGGLLWYFTARKPAEART